MTLNEFQQLTERQQRASRVVNAVADLKRVRRVVENLLGAVLTVIANRETVLFVTTGDIESRRLSRTVLEVIDDRIRNLEQALAAL